VRFLQREVAAQAVPSNRESLWKLLELDPARGGLTVLDLGDLFVDVREPVYPDGAHFCARLSVKAWAIA
jgi:hypothetical protein